MAIKVSALPAGSTSVGGTIPVVQNTQSKKVNIGTAAYINTGTANGEIPVLNSLGAVNVSDGGTGLNTIQGNNKYFGTNASGQVGLYTIPNVGGVLDGSITTAKLQNGAVIASKIGNNQVGIPQLNIIGTFSGDSIIGFSTSSENTARLIYHKVGSNKIDASNTPSINDILIKSSGTNQFTYGLADTANIANGAITAAKLNSSINLDHLPAGTNSKAVFVWGQIKSANKVITEGTVVEYSHRLYVVKQDINTDNSNVRNSNPDNIDLAAYFEPTHLQDVAFQVSSGERYYTFGQQNSGDHEEVVMAFNLDVANDKSQHSLVINEDVGIASYIPSSSTKMDFTNSSTYNVTPIIEFEGTNKTPVAYNLRIPALHSFSISGYTYKSSSVGLAAGQINYNSSNRQMVVIAKSGDEHKIAELFQENFEIRIQKDSSNYVDGIFEGQQVLSGLHYGTYRMDGLTSVGTLANDDEVSIISKDAVFHKTDQISASMGITLLKL